MKNTAIASVGKLVDHILRNVARWMKQMNDMTAAGKFDAVPCRMEAGKAGTDPRVFELPQGAIDRINNEAYANPCNGIGTLDDETAKAILAAFETA